MENKHYFDKLYQESKDLLWKGFIHKKQLKYLLEELKQGKVLDLGAGEGADAIFLAKKGFKVKAADISETAINRIKEIAKKEKVSLEAETADLETYQIKENYDAIISFATIHFLKKEQIDKIIKEIKEHTNKGGINIIMVFREGDETQGDFDMYYFKDGELKQYYTGWEILSYREYEKLDTAHGKPHTHKIATIIAKK
ncbi:methyltransferase domain-containing protein [Candidatus Woesearchaeota archaeon]|nr:methyltransferase domain-containing protein [Candidatus Woesearchaeota archaeon]